METERDEEQIRPTTTHEIKELLRRLKSKKAPGWKRLTNRMLKELPKIYTSI